MRDRSNIEARLRLAEYCLGILEDAKDDPRQPMAVKRIEDQIASLEQELSEIESLGPENPGDIVIGLKPARLVPKSPKKLKYRR